MKTAQGVRVLNRHPVREERPGAAPVTRARARAAMGRAACLMAAGALAATVACAGPSTTASPTSAPAAAAPSSLPLAASPAAAPSSAPAASSSNLTGSMVEDTLQGLIDGARQEGELDLSWAPNTVGGGPGAQQIVDGMNQTYGLNLKLQFTPGPSMPDMAANVGQAYQANQKAASDVVIGLEVHMLTLLNDDALIPEDWQAWSPTINDPRLVGPNGVAVPIATLIPGITYNTNELQGADVPRSMQDLLKPEYKGKLALPPYADNFERMASPDFWGPDKTLDYVKKLSDQATGLLRCGDLSRLTDGEFALFAPDCSLGTGLQAATVQGAPVAEVIPSDFVAISSWWMGVPKNSAHPNAAKLWVSYMLSRTAQDVVWNANYNDLYLLPGSHEADQLNQVVQAGAHPVTIDIAWVVANQNSELQSVGKQIQDILDEKSS